MTLEQLYRFARKCATTPQMPVLFVGHGSPMNAIESNRFTETWKSIGQNLPHPNAIVCVSAHWETKGTQVTAMQMPQTIHDFGGFPQALFEVQYPALGDPALANNIKEHIAQPEIVLDENWGLDHGSWSILKHLFPLANIPVIQLSLDYTQPAQFHYNLGKQLAYLRSKGVLIIGSGNMVHNLSRIAWDKLQEPGYGYDWAIELQTWFTSHIQSKSHEALIHYQKLGSLASLGIPSPEHYLPLLYILGLQNNQDEPFFFNEVAVGGSLTMNSVLFT
jgi:4,5-DOPA dioxygenase extradiol